MMYGLLGLDMGASPEQTKAALHKFAEESLTLKERESILPFLSHLMDIPQINEISDKIAQFSPQALQERINKAVYTFVNAGKFEPRVIIWEDLHWADSPSLSLLESLLYLAM